MRFLLFALSILFFSACSENFVYSEKQVISNTEWTYADTLAFAIPIADTTKKYNLYLDIQHTTDYPYQNIYMNVTTEYPSGKRVTELLPIDFADKTGQWYGDCNAESCQLRVNIQQRAFFNEIGTHRIVFEQYLREDPLRGMQSMALRMEEIKE
ncbi:MAG: gliding motility lipoprotein GldH [Saprospiraceae bacterium]